MIFDKLTKILEDHTVLLDIATEKGVKYDVQLVLVSLFYITRMLSLVVILLMPEYEEIEEVFNEDAPPRLFH